MTPMTIKSLCFDLLNIIAISSGVTLGRHEEIKPLGQPGQVVGKWNVVSAQAALAGWFPSGKWSLHQRTFLYVVLQIMDSPVILILRELILNFIDPNLRSLKGYEARIPRQGLAFILKLPFSQKKTFKFQNEISTARPWQMKNNGGILP